MTDHNTYDELVEGTVDEVKKAVQDNDLDPKAVLKAEKAGRNRVTLTEWLQDYIDSPDTPTVNTREKGFGNVTLRLTVVHAVLLAFAVGAIFGGMATGLAMSVDGFDVTGSIAQDTGTTGQQDTNDDSGSAGTQSGAVEGTVDPSQIDLEGEPSLGAADAPVTVVLFEDFECPFCQRFEQQAGSQIISNYVHSGQVRMVWKDYPLPFHPWAKPSAEAMECVYRQDEAAFWELKDTIFANQNTLSASNVETNILDWAEQQGVSRSAVQSCIDSGDATGAVDADLQEGRDLGVSGTPTVFINGKKIVGAYPYSAFQQVIEEELN